MTVRTPVVFQVDNNGKVQVDPNPDPELPYLPLIMALNFRSTYNKVDSFSELVKELGIEVVICVETWERQKLPLEQLLRSTGLTVISKCRQKVRNNQPGGGCMILVDPNRFFIIEPNIQVPDGVEVIWTVISPKKMPKFAKIKNICIASVYISPKSRFKKQTIAHLVESIQLMKSYYDNDVKYVISGDFNKVSVEDILDIHGSLQSIQTEPT